MFDKLEGPSPEQPFVHRRHEGVQSFESSCSATSADVAVEVLLRRLGDDHFSMRVSIVRGQNWSNLVRSLHLAPVRQEFLGHLVLQVRLAVLVVRAVETMTTTILQLAELLKWVDPFAMMLFQQQGPWDAYLWILFLLKQHGYGEKP
jgi:hypothetical protein